MIQLLTSIIWLFRWEVIKSSIIIVYNLFDVAWNSIKVVQNQTFYYQLLPIVSSVLSKTLEM